LHSPQHPPLSKTPTTLFRKASVPFAGKVSKMGETKDIGHANLAIWMPQELHDDPTFKKLKDKRLII
jgi:hypothetical protein